MSVTEGQALHRVVVAYEDAERWLLRLLAEAVEAGNHGSAAHYEAQADSLGRLLKQATEYLDKVNSGLLPDTVETMREAIAAGAREAVTTIPGGDVVGYASTVPSESIMALTGEAGTAMASQSRAALRSVADAYRHITHRVATRGLTSGAPVTTLIQDALNEYAARGITTFVDGAGRKWSMASYAEMTIRTAASRASNEGRRAAFLDHGIELIRTSHHRTSHPWCAPYQGRILSLTGQTGDVPVQDRVTGEMITVHVTASLAEAEANGYHHANCRHQDHAYIPGFPIPDPPDFDPGEFEALKRQREIERHIRHWKNRGAVALTPREKAAAKTKIKAWQKAQRDHVAAHPYLSRDHHREQIRTGRAEDALPPR